MNTYRCTKGARYSYDREARRAIRIVDLQQLAIQLVLEDVHPSHFGALPPSPKYLLNLAMRKGLVSLDEITMW